jgi:protein-tyrosine-phosphatase
MTNAKPTLLFVCVHNAGRSQLAAGLAAYEVATKSTYFRPVSTPMTKSAT